ncbi:MAG: ABC transporter permease [Prevotella sp.]
MRTLKALIRREVRRLLRNPIYGFCMIGFPLVVMVFFTTLMGDGQPTNMPVGVVDLDNTTTTRKLTRMLDAFQSSEVTGHYNSVEQARRAMQQNEIYAFLYFPKGTTEKLLASRQPQISFYYSMTCLTSGSLLFRDLKTICTLGNAAVGKSVLTAKGATDKQAQALLQPIVIDLHQLSNPWTDYNIYLSTMLVPGVLLLFIFLITPYSIGTELKFGDSKAWLHTAGNSMGMALAGKILPQTLVFLCVMYSYMVYIFGILHFPCPGGIFHILLLGALAVMAAQGFGIFMFSIMPSMRMSMSVCSLWGVLSFSMVGSAFPVSAMDSALQALSWLFPLRHYFMLYQATVFNDYSLLSVWYHFTALLAFALLPFITLSLLKRSMIEYKYLP